MAVRDRRRSSQIQLEQIKDLPLREIVKVINDRLATIELANDTLTTRVATIPDSFLTLEEANASAQQIVQTYAKPKFEGITAPPVPAPVGGESITGGSSGGGGGGGAGGVPGNFPACYVHQAPNMFFVVEQVFAAYPGYVATSCQNNPGGTWDLMDTIVDTLRTYDTRWGYNGKNGNPSDPSQDVVAYNAADVPNEGSTCVYAFDVITGHCGTPTPRWGDITNPYGSGAIWISRGRF